MIKVSFVNPSILAAFLITLFFTFASTASARTPPSREWSGVMERIDHDAKTLAVHSEKKSRTFELIWRDRTQFIHSSKFTSLAALKPGTKVCVFYRAPVFGKPFATRVIWE